VQEYIQRLGGVLAAKSGRPNLPWRFRVIEDKHINAFALPGGFIYVHSRVLQLADSEAELAAVLAHEIGHIEGRHHKAQIEKAMRYQLGLGILGAVLGSGSGSNAALIAGRLLVQGQLTRYSREAENDADRRGVALLARTGFNPLAMSHFLQKLVDAEGARAGHSGGFFDDHPAAAERVVTTRRLASSLQRTNYAPGSLEFLRVSRLMHGKAASKAAGSRILTPKRGARIHSIPSQQLRGARIHPDSR